MRYLVCDTRKQYREYLKRVHGREIELYPCAVCELTNPIYTAADTRYAIKFADSNDGKNALCISPQVNDPENAERKYNRFIRKFKKSVTALFAFNGDTPIGHAMMLYDYRSKTATLEFVVTVAEYQRQGIASALISRLLQDAKTRGIRYVYVHTLPGNEAAIALYEKFGFNFVNKGSFQ